MKILNANEFSIFTANATSFSRLRRWIRSQQQVYCSPRSPVVKNGNLNRAQYTFSRLFDSCQLLSARFLMTDSIRQLKPSTRCLNYLLIAAGIILLATGMNDDLFAVRTTQYNDQRLVEAINAILSYLEGSFGALVMVCAGVGAILSAAFGQYRASLGLLVVAIGSFILRSFISTFFNDVGIQE